MLDMGIGELAVVAVVALIVVGPDRLPNVARRVGRLLSQSRQTLSKVQEEWLKPVEKSEEKPHESNR